MSKNIDKRIVEMSFENEKFERGIKNSKNSLREFTDALEKSDNNKPFSGLSRAWRHDLRLLCVRTNRNWCSQENRLRGSCGRCKIRQVDCLFEPITQGFQELELKMDSRKR